jgi:hypothetical protein
MLNEIKEVHPLRVDVQRIFQKLDVSIDPADVEQIKPIDF